MGNSGVTRPLELGLAFPRPRDLRKGARKLGRKLSVTHVNVSWLRRWRKSLPLSPGKVRQHAIGLLEGFFIPKCEHTEHDSAVHSASVSSAAFP